jgi:hypothetical protein
MRALFSLCPLRPWCAVCCVKGIRCRCDLLSRQKNHILVWILKLPCTDTNFKPACSSVKYVRIPICEIQVYREIAIYNIKLTYLDCTSHLIAEDDVGIVKEPELKVIEAICNTVGVYEPALIGKGRPH